jgi:hypothetical protein
MAMASPPVLLKEASSSRWSFEENRRALHNDLGPRAVIRHARSGSMVRPRGPQNTL